MLNHHTAYLLILAIPFLCWIGGIAGVVLTWGTGYAPVFVILFITGAVVAKYLCWIQRFLYSRCFVEQLRGLPADAWVHLDLEAADTAHRLKLRMDDYGIAVKDGSTLRIHTAKGDDLTLQVEDVVARKVTPSCLTCALVIEDKSTRRTVGQLALTPYYVGKRQDILTDGRKRFSWFCDWSGIADGTPPKAPSARAGDPDNPYAPPNAS